MKNSIIETCVGFFVVLAAAAFLYFGYTSTSKHPSNGVSYKAVFESIDGIALNSEVKMGGVLLGVVTDIKVDPTYQIVVTMKLNDSIKIPDDSSAEIKTPGLMGDKYIEIIPGNSDEFLSANGTFVYTKSASNLEGFINKIVSAFASSKKSN